MTVLLSFFFFNFIIKEQYYFIFLYWRSIFSKGVKKNQLNSLALRIHHIGVKIWDDFSDALSYLFFFSSVLALPDLKYIFFHL